MRILIAVLTASTLIACGDASSPSQVTEEGPATAAPPAPATPATAATWSRLSSGEGEALRLEDNGELIALLVCRADGSGLHAGSDQLSPVMSEERFTVGAGDEAFTLVADLATPRPRGVQASGPIPADFLNRVEAGEPVTFNYGAHTLGPFPSIPAADARAFAGACRDLSD
jgi:hypothetical protein